jgi:hypothetical protein
MQAQIKLGRLFGVQIGCNFARFVAVLWLLATFRK